MIKVYIDTVTNEIIKYEPYNIKEVIIDLSATDSIVICEETNEICRIQESIQGKKRVEELQSKKELDEIEKAELEFLLS